MEQEKLKAGDVAMLNSGGPLMAVMAVDEAYQKAECAWFVEGRLETARFSLATLTKKKIQ
jgi:uncharacterized protein YodC (DUF2158 family)